VKTANSRAAVADLLKVGSFQAACIDLKMQEDSGIRILEFLKSKVPELPVVALVSEGDRKLLPTLRTKGVTPLTAPFTAENLHAAVRAQALPAPLGVTPRPAAPAVATNPSPKAIIADDVGRRTVEFAVRAANSTAAILILGETGTGKSQLAQLVHQHSALRQKPFVTVNCPSLSPELLESDLFGHVRGAFTGAVQDTLGKVAAAEGGTLFLDEIGDLPMAVQPKLLRLLQDKQYERVGETASRTANVRIIAATNRDLKREVAAGRFREDLYYRLNVIAIDVPPLAGRPAAILGAAEAFLEEVARTLGKPAPTLTPTAARALETYSWPGNLRELRNLIERAAILASGPRLDVADFPALTALPAAARCQVGDRVSLHALETAHIQMIVASSASLEEAARILAIDKSTLYRKRKQMDALVENFTLPPVSRAVASAG
jgi:NtrC-family two-component system response regulator AlgB